MSADHVEREANWLRWLEEHDQVAGFKLYAFRHNCGATNEIDEHPVLADMMCSGCRFQLDMRDPSAFEPVYQKGEPWTPAEKETTMDRERCSEPTCLEPTKDLHLNHHHHVSDLPGRPVYADPCYKRCLANPKRPLVRAFDNVGAIASPDAPTATNEHGGKQSHMPVRFDLIDGKALFAMAAVLHEGAEKYGADNWRKISVEDHLNHLIMHAYAYLSGDRTDDHLSHIMCRATFAEAVVLTPFTPPEGGQDG